AAEDGVRRSRSGARELGARDPANAALDAGLIEDRLRELGPGAVARGGDVPDPAGPLDQHTHSLREMADVRRAAALVVDDRHLVPLATALEHRPDEVPAGRPEEPRRTDDPVAESLAV